MAVLYQYNYIGCCCHFQHYYFNVITVWHISQLGCSFSTTGASWWWLHIFQSPWGGMLQCLFTADINIGVLFVEGDCFQIHLLSTLVMWPSKASLWTLVSMFVFICARRLIQTWMLRICLSQAVEDEGKQEIFKIIICILFAINQQKNLSTEKVLVVKCHYVL